MIQTQFCREEAQLRTALQRGHSESWHNKARGSACSNCCTVRTNMGIGMAWIKARSRYRLRVCGWMAGCRASNPSEQPGKPGHSTTLSDTAAQRTKVLRPAIRSPRWIEVLAVCPTPSSSTQPSWSMIALIGARGWVNVCV